MTLLARAALWLGVPVDADYSLGELKTLHVLAQEARADFIAAVALGISLAFARPQDRRRILKVVHPDGEVKRKPTAAALQMMGIGVRMHGNPRNGGR